MPVIRVSQETLDEATAFATPMEKLMNMLDEIAFSDDRVMNDQTYLEMGKALMEINQLKTQVKETVIYRTAIRQASATVMNPRISAADMAANPEYYTCCPACKTYMTKRHFKEKHGKAKKCSHILQLRNFNAIKGTGEIKKKTKRAGKQKKEVGHTQDVEATIVQLAEVRLKHKFSTIYGDDPAYLLERRVNIPTAYVTDMNDKDGVYEKKGRFWKTKKKKVKKMKKMKVIVEE
tara:strand:- start:31 stop:732 length:702 start_codon:yes stop_codon:yes gene_type:complete